MLCPLARAIHLMSPTHALFAAVGCRASVQQSLKDLGIEQLDLVLMHWPEAWLPGSDPEKEIQPDTSITLLEAWWVGVECGFCDANSVCGTLSSRSSQALCGAACLYIDCVQLYCVCRLFWLTRGSCR
jgi:hypothetical protein